MRVCRTIMDTGLVESQQSYRHCCTYSVTQNMYCLIKVKVHLGTTSMSILFLPSNYSSKRVLHSCVEVYSSTWLRMEASCRHRQKDFSTRVKSAGSIWLSGQIGYSSSLTTIPNTVGLSRVWKCTNRTKCDTDTTQDTTTGKLEKMRIIANN